MTTSCGPRPTEAYAILCGYSIRMADVNVAFLHVDEVERVTMRLPGEWRCMNLGKLWLPRKPLGGRRSATAVEPQANGGMEASSARGYTERIAQPTLLRPSSKGVVVQVHVCEVIVAGSSVPMTDLMVHVKMVLLLKVGERTEVRMKTVLM